MQAIGTITTSRLNNTRNGNPRYSVELVMADGSTVSGSTAGDHSFAYSMPTEGPAACRWHVTPTGRVVFDDIRKA